MLTTSKQMILEAQKGQYAIGCFNTSDLEMTKAIIATAEKTRSSVIVATSEKAIAYAGLETLVAIIKTEAQRIHAGVALHLDHGRSLNIVKDCLKAGYTSVMYDGSALNYEENVTTTREAVRLANKFNVPCEGELGALGNNDFKKNFTDPNKVSDFVSKTGVDFLAVSIGSKHGIASDEKLDIELLKKIRKITNIPLVLHGGSGVGSEDIKEAIKAGICKINIDTEIRQTFTTAIRDETQDNPKENDPRKILSKAVQEVQKLVEEKIKLFGSDGKR